ncbi:MAG: hypothetical protein PWP31_1815 [Clostridia bacterium]|jgi:hypothetical protein|nr:hypothetical protein [Clostridia bacterium]
MTLGEIINRTCRRVDEDNTDQEIRQKIKDAVNEGYMDLAQIDVIPVKTTVTAVDYKFTPPNDLFRISQIMQNGEIVEWKRRGNDYFSAVNGDLDLYYYKIPNELQDDSDIPEISERNHYLLVLYGAYGWYESEGEFDKAENFLNKYESKKARIKLPGKGNLQFTVIR